MPASRVSARRPELSQLQTESRPWIEATLLLAILIQASSFLSSSNPPSLVPALTIGWRDNTCKKYTAVAAAQTKSLTNQHPAMASVLRLVEEWLRAAGLFI